MVPSFVLFDTEFSSYVIFKRDLEIAGPGLLLGTHELIALGPPPHKWFDKQVSATTLTSHSLHAVVRETQIFFGIELITGMQVRIGLRPDAHHGKGIRRSRRKLSVVSGGTKKNVYLGGDIVRIGVGRLPKKLRIKYEKKSC